MKNLEKKLVAQVQQIEELVPGNLIIHKLPEFSLVYLSRLAKKNIGIPEDENREMKFREYFATYFDLEASKDIIKEFLEKMPQMSDDDSFSYFQYVKTVNALGKFDCFIASTKILHRDEEGAPLYTLTIAHHIKKDQKESKKVQRLLDEMKLHREKLDMYESLTKREIEILRLMARNETSSKIAEILFIAESTVATHRRNIKKKIGAKTDFDVISFAQTFDII